VAGSRTPWQIRLRLRGVREALPLINDGKILAAAGIAAIMYRIDLKQRHPSLATLIEGAVGRS